MCTTKSLVICTLCSFVVLGSGDITETKTWRANTNFANPRNWEEGRLPCSNDRMVIGAGNLVAVYMPKTSSIAEVVLPLNGQLIFPENAVFNITGGTAAESCVGQDMHFRPPSSFWHDPGNWNITSASAFPSAPQRRNAAVPHVLRVPCTTDRVVFPPESAFRVHFLRPYVTVSDLHINGNEYNDMALKSLLSTHTGRLLFPEFPTLNVHPQPCTDPTGCVCSNEDVQVLNTVCTFATPCQDLECSDPIEVEGNCCPICGTKITANYINSFVMKKLQQFYRQCYNQEEFLSVDSYISKTIQSNIQSVFVDGTPGNRQANKLADMIYNTISSDSSYGLDNIKILKSLKWRTKNGIDFDAPSSEGLSSGGTAVIVLIILGLVIAAAFYIYRKRRIPGFSFARFDLGSDKIEFQLGTTPHEDLEPGEPATAGPEDQTKKAFDNPVYESTAPVERDEASQDDGGDEEEKKNFVENPMFMIFEESLQKDST